MLLTGYSALIHEPSITLTTCSNIFMFPVQIAVFKMVKTSYQFQKLLSLLAFLVTSQTIPFQRHTHFCEHNAPEKYFSFKLFFFFLFFLQNTFFQASSIKRLQITHFSLKQDKNVCYTATKNLQ